MTDAPRPASTRPTAALCRPDRPRSPHRGQAPTSLAALPLEGERPSKTTTPVSVPCRSEPGQVRSHGTALPWTAAGVPDSAGAVASGRGREPLVGGGGGARGGHPAGPAFGPHELHLWAQGPAACLLTCITHLFVQSNDLGERAVIFRTCLSNLINDGYCRFFSP